MMNHQLTLIGRIVAFVGLLFVASPALAQDAGRVGMVLGYPATAGVHWQITDRFAIRADATYGWSSFETTSDASEPVTNTLGGGSIVFGVPQLSTHTESSIQTGSFGIAGLITLHKTDDLRLYVAPKISFGIVHSSRSITTEVTGPPEFLMFFPDRFDDFSFAETTTYSTSYSGSFGGSTMINRRFGLFAEAGVVFNWSDAPVIAVGVARIESSGKSVSTRGAVGVTLFF